MEVKYVIFFVADEMKLMKDSEHKKDPGIPNDFPYKDQILAEVAEQRRVVRLLFYFF